MPYFWYLEELESLHPPATPKNKKSRRRRRRSSQGSSHSSIENEHGNLRPKNPLRKNKHKVRFDTKPPVNIGLYRSVEELGSKWYSQTELAAICSRNLEQSSRAMVEQASENGDDFLRGLENLSEDHMVRRRILMANSIKAVLIEQSRQQEEVNRDDGSDVPNTVEQNARDIRRAYRICNQSSCYEARRRGLMDRKSVKNNFVPPKLRNSKALKDDSTNIKKTEQSSQDITTTNPFQQSSLCSFGEDYLDELNEAILVAETGKDRKRRLASSLSKVKTGGNLHSSSYRKHTFGRREHYGYFKGKGLRRH